MSSALSFLFLYYTSFFSEHTLSLPSLWSPWVSTTVVPAPISLISFLFTLSEFTDGVLATRVGWFMEYAFVFLGNIRRGSFSWDESGFCFDWTNAIMYRASGLLLSLSPLHHSLIVTPDFCSIHLVSSRPVHFVI